MSVQENNAPPRRTAVDGITGLRLYPLGASAQLVNMSSSGLLAESTARVTVGAAVTVGFDGGFTPSTARGHIVRCDVTSMAPDGSLRYYIAVEFEKPVPMPGDAETPPPPAPVASIVRNRW
jgi:hypothetical protein